MIYSPVCIRLCRRQFGPAKLAINEKDEMKYSKGKKGPGFYKTHNGTKKTATNLLVLFSEERNKKETTIPLEQKKKFQIIFQVICISVISIWWHFQELYPTMRPTHLFISFTVSQHSLYIAATRPMQQLIAIIVK